MAILAVSRMVGLLLVRSTAQATGMRRSQVRGLVIGIGVAGVVMVALLSVATTVALSPGAPTSILLMIHTTWLAGSSIMGGLVIITLAVMSPPQDALRNVMELLPVSHRAASVGARLPNLALAALVSLTLGLTGFAASVRLIPTWGHGLRVLMTLVLLLGIVVLTVGSAVIALRSVVRASLRLPAYQASTVAGAIAIATVLLAWGGHLLPRYQRVGPTVAFGWREALDLPVTAAHVALGLGGVSPIAVLLAWLVGAGCFFVWTAEWDSRVHPPAVLLLGRGMRWPRRSFSASAWIEMLYAIRNPQATLAALTAPALVAGLMWLARSPVPLEIVSALAMAPPLMIALLAAYSVGRTRPHHWVAATVTGSRHSWLWPKALAALACAACFAAAVGGAEVAGGLLPGSAAGEIIWRVATVTSASLLAGTLVPYVEEVGLTAATATLTATVFALAGGLFVQEFQKSAPRQLGQMVLIAALLTAYFLATHRLRPELGRRV